MAGSIGKAFIEVGAEMAGFESDVSSGVDAAVGKTRPAADKGGSKFMGWMGGALKKGAVATGSVLTTALGTSIVKGFNRLRTIDDAQGKLKGLGHDAASVTRIMDNAGKAVEGTAFGLGDAATAAAGAVASGVKPGQDLVRTLTLIGDTAAIAGADYGEMGSIFNKVAATGKAQGDVLAQLGDRGIPILQFLAKEMGVTEAQVSELASKGKIDFKTFQNALEKGLGGAAQESGKTFRGALANVGAAMGRFGAALIGPAFQAAPALFDKLRVGINVLTKVVGPLSEQFFDFVSIDMSQLTAGAKAAFDGLRQSFAAAGGGMDGLKIALGNVKAAIAPIAAAFSEVGKQILSALSPALGTLGGLLTGTVLPALSFLLPILGQVGAILLKAFGGAVVGVIKGFVNVVTGVIDVIMGLVNVVAGVFTGDWSRAWSGIQQIFIGAITAIGGALGVWWNVTFLGAFRRGIAMLTGPLWRNLWTTLLGLARSGWSAITGFFTGAVTGLGNVFAGLGGIIGRAVSSAMSAVAGFFSTGLAAAGNIVRAGLQGIVSAFSALGGLLGAAARAVWSFVGSAFQTGVAGLGNIVRAGLNLIVTVFRSVGSILGSAATAIWATIRAAFTSGVAAASSAVTSGMAAIRAAFISSGAAISSAAKALWATLRSVFSAGVAAIRSVVTSGMAAVTNAFRSAGTAISSAVSTAVNAARGLFTSGIAAIRSAVTSGMAAVTNAFRTAGSNIRAAVSSAVSTARSLFVSGMAAIRSAVSSGISGVIGLFRALPGQIRGALGGLASTLYSVGVQMIQGLISGIRNMAGAAASAAAGVVGSAIDRARSMLKIGSPSKVFMEMGEQTGQGYVLGMGSMNRAAGAAGAGLAGAATAGAASRPLKPPTGSALSAATPPSWQTIYTAAPAAATTSRDISVTQNFYGPATASAQAREMSWAARFGSSDMVVTR